jgi:hypothetical protein
MVRTFGGGGSALDLDRQVDKTITTSQRPPAIPSKPRPLMLGMTHGTNPRSRGAGIRFTGIKRVLASDFGFTIRN